MMTRERSYLEKIAEIYELQDNPVRQDACWALSYLTDGSDEQIKVAGDANCMPALMPLVQSGNDAEVAPAIRVFGNFATGSDDLTQVSTFTCHQTIRVRVGLSDVTSGWKNS